VSEIGIRVGNIAGALGVDWLAAYGQVNRDRWHPLPARARRPDSHIQPGSGWRCALVALTDHILHIANTDRSPYWRLLGAAKQQAAEVGGARSGFIWSTSCSDACNQIVERHDYT
jgi:hypothetical protein